MKGNNAKYNTVGLLRIPSFPTQFMKTIKNDNDLLSIIQSTSFLDSVFAANPKFHERVVEFLDGEKGNDIKKETRIIHTLYKYFSRACHRCTPYGLFSKSTAPKVNFSNSPSRVFKINQKEELFFDVDGVLLHKILSAIKRDFDLKFNLKFVLNNSVIHYENQLLYFDFEIKANQFINYDLSGIETNEVLNEIVTLCNDSSKTIQECTAFILPKFPEVDKADLITYLRDLIDANILIPEIDLCLFSPSPLKYILSILDELGDAASKKWSARINELSLIFSDDSLNLFDKKIETEKWCANAKIKIEGSGDLFSIDKRIPKSGVFENQKIQISNDLIDQMFESRRLLTHVNKNENKNLSDFKKEFNRRYGEKSVPLLHALNPLIGIGYFINNEDLDNLTELNNFTLPRQKSTLISLSPFEQILHKKLLKDKKGIFLDKIIKNQELSLNENDDFSSTMAFTKLINGGENIYLREFTEISATRFLKRFGRVHPLLNDELNRIIKLENEACSNENKLLVEFFHLPEMRMTNLLRFSTKRHYECGSIYPSREKENVSLKFDDIYLKLVDNSLKLFSKSHEKEIIPIISNSLNPRAYPFNVFNFLYDLQGQHKHFDLYFTWGNLEKLFRYFPRVYYKKILLSPTTWKLNKEELNSRYDLDKWRQKRDMPKELYLSNSMNSDELLYVDLDSELGKEVFFSELERKKSLFAIEVLDQDKYVRNDSDFGYNNELLIPLVRKRHGKTKRRGIDVFNCVKEKHSPSSDWLFYKLYCSNTWAEKFLKDHFYDFIDKGIDGTFLRYFFVRYEDEGGFHLRIRFDLSKTTDKEKVRNCIGEYFNNFLSDFKFSRIVIDTYEPEINRYKNESLKYCEELFVIDSRIVVDVMRVENNSRFLSAIYGIDNYLNLFDFSLETKAYLINDLSIAFTSEFNLTKKSKIELDKKYRSLEKNIFNILTKKNHNELKTLFDSNFHEMKALCHKINLTEQDIFDLSQSLIHMFLNRLFISNPRYNEMFVYYTLAKHYKRLLGIKKNT